MLSNLDAQIAKGAAEQINFHKSVWLSELEPVIIDWLDGDGVQFGLMVCFRLGSSLSLFVITALNGIDIVFSFFSNMKTMIFMLHTLIIEL